MNIRNITLVSILGAAALTATLASAADNNYYVQLNGGASFGLATKGDFGNKPAGASGLVGLEGGYKINDHFRAGVGVDYRTGYSFREFIVDTDDDVPINQYSKMKVKSLVVMANLYYDITEIKGFTPYVTVGAGVARNKLKFNLHDSTVGRSAEDYDAEGAQNNFAYKVGVGAKYAVSQNIDFDLRYQFVDLGKIKTVANDRVLQNQKGKLRNNEVMVGLAYKF